MSGIEGLPNLNAAWSALLLEELWRCGLRRIALAPGSRSAPLAAAAAADGRFELCLWVDERAAAYFALGCARGGDAPAAVITTSGTAAVNLLPAVVEADLDLQPLILLSADRPPEKRRCGANQSVEQLGLFQGRLRWQFDMPCPTEKIPAAFVLDTADQLWRRATQHPAGPVQLNCMFREPLAPERRAWSGEYLAPLADWLEGGGPRTVCPPPCFTQDGAAAAELSGRIDRARRGLLVAGGLRRRADREAVTGLVERLAWPFLADICSGLRLGEHPGLLRHFDLWEPPPEEPDLVIQLGGRLVSRRIQEYLAGLSCPWILVDEDPERLDPLHAVSERLTLSPAALAARLELSAGGAASHKGGLFRSWQEIDRRAARVIAREVDEGVEFSEAWLLRRVCEWTPGEYLLFLGNSLPVRQADGLADRRGEGPVVLGNRGASGIDGLLATAAGAVAGARRPGVLVLGDLSLLHDLGSLWILRDLRERLVIVLVNNGGGGIFSLLPLAGHPQVLSPWCDAAHELRLAGIAREFGISARGAESREAFRAAWESALAGEGPCLIEACCLRGGHALLAERIRRGIRDAAAGA